MGQPLRFILSPGNTHDSQIGRQLLLSTPAKAVLADKAYHSKEIVDFALSKNMKVVIPSKSNSIAPRAIELHQYKERHLIENLFQRMKVFRRVATRYDKLAVNFLSFVYIAGIFKWLH